MTATPKPFRLLVAIDGSRHADDAAAAAARLRPLLGPIHVELFSVDPMRDLREYATDHGRAITRAMEHATTAAASARAMLEREGVTCHVQASVGEPATEIARHADSGSFDGIVIGTRGLGNLENLVLGSVAYKVTHLAKVPVTLVRTAQPSPAAPPGPARILLASDGSPTAERALAYVTGLAARGLKPVIELVNVQLPVLSGNVRRFISQEAIDQWHRDEGHAALAAAEAALAAAGLEYTRHILVGHLAEAIAQAATRLGCACIVMGTHGHGAVKSTVLGSVAHKVVHLAEVPVTLVR